MNTNTIEKLTWVLIYGGLLSGAVALAMQERSDVISLTLGVVGIVATVAGVVLIGVRSRMGR